jgi:hypothetical protein
MILMAQFFEEVQQDYIVKCENNRPSLKSCRNRYE